MLTIGVDLGGTKVECAIVDKDANILASKRFLTYPSKEPERIISDVVKSVKALLEETGKQADALGVGAAGQISKDGKVQFSPNLQGWLNVPIKEMLEKALGIPITVTNDVRAATIGEWRHGAGKGIDDTVCLFVGTGIGGGIVSGGHLLEGCMNSAGELGHMTLVAGGRLCHCGNRGCFEAYAGGWAIAERAKEAVSADEKAGKGLVAEAGTIDKITSKSVSDAYKSGDKLAERIIKETATFLAAGATGIVNALNPCLLLLGGGVICGMPEYLLWP